MICQDRLGTSRVVNTPEWQRLCSSRSVRLATRCSARRSHCSRSPGSRSAEETGEKTKTTRLLFDLLCVCLSRACLGKSALLTKLRSPNVFSLSYLSQPECRFAAVKQQAIEIALRQWSVRCLAIRDHSPLPAQSPPAQPECHQVVCSRSAPSLCTRTKTGSGGQEMMGVVGVLLSIVSSVPSNVPDTYHAQQSACDGGAPIISPIFP